MKTRSIRMEMVSFLDERLAGNGLAKLHIANKNPRGLMVEAAKVCVGIKEATGKNDGVMVNLIQDTVGDASELPWCMSFVQTMLAYAEVKTGIASKLPATEGCLDLFRWVKRNDPSMFVKYNPLSGAIIIWRHGKTENGHTGLVLDCDEGMFHAVEGNTSGYLSKDAPVDRNGNGVFYTARSRYGNGDMAIMGFIKPYV